MTFFLHETLYRNLAPIAEQRITICGTGALGANLAETLARMGLRKLRVIDRDRIEAHNLSTQPWTQQDVGAAKVRVLANMVYRAVGAPLEAQQTELSGENASTLLRGSSVVIDAFDNLPARMAVTAACTQLEIPCLHVALAATGDYGCGLWNEAYVTSGDQRQTAQACNYPLTRPLVLMVAAAGAEVVVEYLANGKRRGFEATLRDLQLKETA